MARRTNIALVLAAMALGVGYWFYGQVQAQEQQDARPGLQCRDFDSQAEAQRYLRENPDNSDVLDNDPGGPDGIACETFDYDDPARDETPVNIAGGGTTTPSPPSPAPQPPPSPSPSPPSRPTPAPTPPPESGTLMNAGGATSGPMPMMPNGSCPREFPEIRDGVCYS